MILHGVTEQARKDLLALGPATLTLFRSQIKKAKEAGDRAAADCFPTIKSLLEGDAVGERDLLALAYYIRREFR